MAAAAFQSSRTEGAPSPQPSGPHARLGQRQLSRGRKRQLSRRGSLAAGHALGPPGTPLGSLHSPFGSPFSSRPGTPGGAFGDFALSDFSLSEALFGKSTPGPSQEASQGKGAAAVAAAMHSPGVRIGAPLERSNSKIHKQAYAHILDEYDDEEALETPRETQPQLACSPPGATVQEAGGPYAPSDVTVQGPGGAYTPSACADSGLGHLAPGSDRSAGYSEFPSGVTVQGPGGSAAAAGSLPEAGLSLSGAELSLSGGGQSKNREGAGGGPGKVDEGRTGGRGEQGEGGGASGEGRFAHRALGLSLVVQTLSHGLGLDTVMPQSGSGLDTVATGSARVTPVEGESPAGSSSDSNPSSKPALPGQAAGVPARMPQSSTQSSTQLSSSPLRPALAQGQLQGQGQGAQGGVPGADPPAPASPSMVRALLFGRKDGGASGGRTASGWGGAQAASPGAKARTPVGNGSVIGVKSKSVSVNVSEGGTAKRARGGSSLGVQQRLLYQLLLNNSDEEGGGGGRGLGGEGVPGLSGSESLWGPLSAPTHADVSRVAGLAASVASRQPVSAAVCLLHLLDKLGDAASASLSLPHHHHPSTRGHGHPSGALPASHPYSSAPSPYPNASFSEAYSYPTHFPQEPPLLPWDGISTVSHNSSSSYYSTNSSGMNNSSSGSGSYYNSSGSGIGSGPWAMGGGGLGAPGYTGGANGVALGLGGGYHSQGYGYGYATGMPHYNGVPSGGPGVVPGGMPNVPGGAPGGAHPGGVPGAVHWFFRQDSGGGGGGGLGGRRSSSSSLSWSSSECSVAVADEATLGAVLRRFVLMCIVEVLQAQAASYIRLPDRLASIQDREEAPPLSPSPAPGPTAAKEKGEPAKGGAPSHTAAPGPTAAKAEGEPTTGGRVSASASASAIAEEMPAAPNGLADVDLAADVAGAGVDHAADVAGSDMAGADAAGEGAAQEAGGSGPAAPATTPAASPATDPTTDPATNPATALAPAAAAAGGGGGAPPVGPAPHAPAKVSSLRAKAPRLGRLLVPNQDEEDDIGEVKRVSGSDLGGGGSHHSPALMPGNDAHKGSRPASASANGKHTGTGTANGGDATGAGSGPGHLGSGSEAGSGAGTGAGGALAVGRPKPYALSEIAEIRFVEATASGSRMNPVECAHLDKLHAPSAPLGPGVVALALAVELQSLDGVRPEDVAELADWMEDLGCNEAAYRARIRAVSDAWGASEGDLRGVLQATLMPRGSEPVGPRLARLLASLEGALTRASTEEARSGFARCCCSVLTEPLAFALQASPGRCTAGILARLRSTPRMPAPYPIPTPTQACTPSHLPSSPPSSSSNPSISNGSHSTQDADPAMATPGLPGARQAPSALSLAWPAASSGAGEEGEEEEGAVGWEQALAQGVLRIGRHWAADDDEDAAAFKAQCDACAHVLLTALIGAAPGSWKDQEAAVERALRAMDGAEFAATGWLAWKAIGGLLERDDEDNAALRQLWAKTVKGTYQAINAEGSGADTEALDALDWALESLLLLLPPGPECATALLCLIGPEAGECVDVVLAVAARVACTIYWRWPHRKDSVRFVAQLLVFAHKEVGMSPEQLQRALKVGERLFGWTMPDADRFAQRCESPEEAQELRAEAIIAAWYSVADWSRGPIELVGSQWPYN